jgi:hypothetical protein
LDASRSRDRLAFNDHAAGIEASGNFRRLFALN